MDPKQAPRIQQEICNPDPDYRYDQAIAYLRAIDRGQRGYLDEVARIIEELLGRVCEAEAQIRLLGK